MAVVLAKALELKIADELETEATLELEAADELETALVVAFRKLLEEADEELTAALLETEDAVEDEAEADAVELAPARDSTLAKSVPGADCLLFSSMPEK